MKIRKYLPIKEMSSLPFLDFYPNMNICVMEGLICFEGPNFVGKSTVIPIVQKKLIERGYRVGIIKQPLNTELVVNELNEVDLQIGRSRHQTIMEKKQEIFRKDRYQVEQFLRYKMDEFDFYLMDRGELSTAVCQGKPYSFVTLQPQLTLSLVMEDTSILIERSKNRVNRGTLDPSPLELEYRNSLYLTYTDLLDRLFSTKENNRIQKFIPCHVDWDYGSDLEEMASSFTNLILSYTRITAPEST